MICRVSKSRITGTIACPSNKSYTHRAIFLASLAGDSTIQNALLSADTEATIDACRRLGAEIKVADSITVRTPINLDADVPHINAENSGTTIRIAAGIAGLFSKPISLTGDASLRRRPMQPLLDALSCMGAQCISEDGRPPISIQGRISGGSVYIPGNVSSQFASSLLICAPLTAHGIDLSIKDGLVSKPYLDATIVSMRKFGVNVQTLIPYLRYHVAPQAYSRASFDVPVDSSSMALLLAAAAITGDGLDVEGSMGNLPQGDEAFLGILEHLGYEMIIGKSVIFAGPSGELGGGKFDLGNSPDLLPPLAILALHSSEPIEITNVGHARLKETDRIAILARELPKLGVKVQEKKDGLVLERGDRLHGADLDSAGDHRLFMAFCIAGMYVGDCTVTDPESVRVSYPGFVDQMRRLGADIVVSQK